MVNLVAAAALATIAATIGTESDSVLLGLATKSAGLVIVSVAVRIGAALLEHIRILAGLALFCRVVFTTAAVLIIVESGTGALASTIFTFELIGTGRQTSASGRLALALAAFRGDADGQVEAVDEANIIEALTAVTLESKLGKRDGRAIVVAVATTLTSPEAALPVPVNLKIA